MAHTENDGRGPLPTSGHVKRKDREHGAHDKWPSQKLAKPGDLTETLAWLKEYADDMHAWGQRVRLDIRALEEGIGHDPGDPGDPPAPPW